MSREFSPEPQKELNRLRKQVQDLERKCRVWRQLVDGVIDFILVFDSEGVCKYASPSCSPYIPKGQHLSFQNLRFLGEGFEAAFQVLLTDEVGMTYRSQIKRAEQVVTIEWQLTLEEEEGQRTVLTRGVELSKSRGSASAVISGMVSGFIRHEPIKAANGDVVDHLILSASQAFSSLCGIDVEQLVGGRAQEVFSHLQLDGWLEHYSSLETDVVRTINHFSSRTGKHFRVHRHLSSDGVYTTAFQDISSEHRAKKELERSEDLFRLIAENSSDGLLVIAHDQLTSGRVIFASASFAKIMGIELDSCYKTNLNSLFRSIHPVDKARVRAGFERSFQQQATRLQLVYRIRHGQGHYFWREDRIVFTYSEDKLSQIYISCSDVSERKRAETLLQNSEARLRQIYENMAVGIAEVGLDFKIRRANEAYCQMLGFSEGELIGRHLGEITHPEQLKENLRLQHRLALGEISHFRLEKTFLHRDGYEVYGILDANLVRDSAGKPDFFIGSVLDITDRQRAEDSLRWQKRVISLNNRIAKVFLTSPPDDIFSDVLQVLLMELKSTYGLFGYLDENRALVVPSMTRDVWTKCQMQNKELIFPPESWGGIWGDSLELKESLIANEGLHPPEGHIKLKNALSVPILHRREAIGLLVVANKNGGYSRRDLALLENVADQTAPVLAALLQNKRQSEAHQILEEQYHQAQKMESIGRLAGGVAHDLNNMLSPILGYSELLADEMSSIDPRRESVLEIQSAGLKARDMVRQLLAFSRKQALEFRSIDLSQLLIEFKKLLLRTIREDVRITLSASQELPVIEGDKGQIEQVILNLAVNAQDAMPHGGNLQIETDFQYIADERRTLQPGGYVICRVIDNGAGIPAKILERIFEPFFTTKSIERGTGLGLATAHGIVHQHGGTIEVESEVGFGTTFTLYFPASEKRINEVLSSSTSFSDMKSGFETILVAEDDKQVRELTQIALTRMGYHVLVAESGEEALQLLSVGERRVDLLVSDVVMPQMNGKELFSKAARLYPQLKVLYMSGYSNDVIAQSVVMDEGIEFLHKPFSISQLLARVRRVLDGAQAPI